MKRCSRIAVLAVALALIYIGAFAIGRHSLACLALLALVCPLMVILPLFPHLPWLAIPVGLVFITLWASAIEASIWRRKRYYLPLMLIGVLLFHVGVSYSAIDGFQGIVYRAVLSEDTEYSPGYSDRGFKRIEAGMTRAQVYELVGHPLDTWTNDDHSVGERWSRSPSDSNFRCRVVQFTNGVVHEKHTEFYED